MGWAPRAQGVLAWLQTGDPMVLTLSSRTVGSGPTILSQHFLPVLPGKMGSAPRRGRWPAGRPPRVHPPQPGEPRVTQLGTAGLMGGLSFLWVEHLLILLYISLQFIFL